MLPSNFQLKRKRLEGGSIDVYKARFCAGGHKQIYGSDYDLTYSPVIGFEIVRLLLSIVSKERMFTAQVDIKGAFLYPDIDAQIVIEQPTGFKEGTEKEDLVGELLKGI